MSMIGRFALYAAVLVVSASLVAAGAGALSRMPPTHRVVIASAWLAAHVVAAIVGLGGPAVGTVLVLGSSVAGGVLLARTLRSPGAVVALAVTASIVDIVSFTTGPTSWLLNPEGSGGSSVLRYLTVSFPRAGGFVAVVGIGDLLIFGALFLALRTMAYRAWVAAAVLEGGLLAALLVGVIRGGAFGIPFMAVGAILLSVRATRRSGPERSGPEAAP